MMKQITVTTTNATIILALLLNLSIGGAVFIYVYGWMQVQELKAELSKANNILIVELIENCYGQWTSWTGAGLLNDKERVQFTCNESAKQSYRRANQQKGKR